MVINWKRGTVKKGWFSSPWPVSAYLIRQIPVTILHARHFYTTGRRPRRSTEVDIRFTK